MLALANVAGMDAVIGAQFALASVVVEQKTYVGLHFGRALCFGIRCVI